MRTGKRLGGEKAREGIVYERKNPCWERERKECLFPKGVARYIKGVKKDSHQHFLEGREFRLRREDEKKWVRKKGETWGPVQKGGEKSRDEQCPREGERTAGVVLPVQGGTAGERGGRSISRLRSLTVPGKSYGGLRGKKWDPSVYRTPLS